MKRGALIIFDGIDGAGKTTQVDLLASALRDQGEDVVVSKEPTRGQWGERLRQSAQDGRLPLEEELDLFMRDRREHIEKVIGPGLERGAIVILDRYFYSTIAYQGSRGGDVESIRDKMREFPNPDVAIVLDIDPRVGLVRVADRDGQPNHFESMEQLKSAREIFLELNGGLARHIDGGASIEAVYSQVLDVLLEPGGAIQAARCAKSWGCEDPGRCSYKISSECRWIALRNALLTSSDA